MFSKFSIARNAALIWLALFVNPATLAAHAYPAVSIPNNGATVKESPREVRIQFTEAVEISFSQITVKGPNGEVVSGGKLRQLANDTLAIDVKSLAAGNYSVEWQVLSVDTHITDGTLRFTVAIPLK
jgi:methionine-rich copper-binding protein CopC